VSGRHELTTDERGGVVMCDVCVVRVVSCERAFLLRFSLELRLLYFPAREAPAPWRFLASCLWLYVLHVRARE
jgi:hypothetical protein